MGCFGYICPICKKNIRSGEHCVMQHKRDGKIIGSASGIYDGYGRVKGNDSFRGEEGENSHREICASEFELPSSFCHGYKRVLPNGEIVNISWILSIVKAFRKNHSFEWLKQNPPFLHFINDELKHMCEKQAKLLLQMNQDKNSQTDNQMLDLLSKDLLSEKIGTILGDNEKCFTAVLNWAEKLPMWTEANSGIVAVHTKCFTSIKREK